METVRNEIARENRLIADAEHRIMEAIKNKIVADFKRTVLVQLVRWGKHR